MQYIVNSLTGFNAITLIADIALDEKKAGPLFWGDQALDFIQVLLVPGGKVVQADDFLVELQEVLKKVGAYKPSEAGY